MQLKISRKYIILKSNRRTRIMVQAAYLKSQGLGYPFSRKDGPLIAVSTIFKLKADEIVECMI